MTDNLLQRQHLKAFLLNKYLTPGKDVTARLASAFIRIFNDSPALLEMGSWTLRVYLATFFLMSAQMSIQQVFVSVSRAKSAVFVACVRKVILLIPLIYILPNFFEDNVFAVFLAEPVSDFLSVVTATALFLCTMRKVLWPKGEKKQERKVDA